MSIGGIAIALVVLGILRLALVVVHEPMLGYANQYDTIRVGACVGLYPDLPGEERFAATPSAPIPRHVLGDRLPASCVYGTEVLFAAAVVATHRLFSSEPGIDLHWIGALKLVAVAALAIAAAWMFRPFPHAALLHGATFFAVIADPMVSLWFNSMYAEVPILAGAYCLLAGLSGSLLEGRITRVPALLCVIGALLLGLSKLQFAMLPITLILISLPVIARGRRLLPLMVIVAGLVPIAVFVNPHKEGASRANVVDTYLGALPISSNDPLRTLRTIGLPERCAPLIGTNWFLPRGENVRETCPEVLRLPPSTFLKVAAHEPTTILVALAKAAAPSQNAFSGYLGFVAGVRYGGFEAIPPWAGSLWEGLFLSMPARYFVAVLAVAMVLSLLLFVIVVVLFFRKRIESNAFAITYYLSLLGICYGYTLATSVLGDGFGDLGKHVLLGSTCLAAGLIAGCGFFALTSMSRIHRPLRIPAALVLSAAIACAYPLLIAYQGLSLAMGVMDNPGNIRLKPGPFRIEGWALDPFGVASVEARSGGSRIRAAYGGPYPDLQRVFPAMPKSSHGAFSLEVPSGFVTPEHPVLSIVVTNILGVETDIDRRRLL